MNSRRIALSLGSIGSGFLAAAFLHPAVAGADSYNITPDSSESETFTAIAGQPPQDQAVAGMQLYDYQDLTDGNSGTFAGLSLNDVGASGATNQEILDYSAASAVMPRPDTAANALVAAGDGSLPQGSVFDTVNYGNGFENEYTDIAGTGSGGANTITDTVVTPFGNFNLPTTFDAITADQAADFTYPSTSGVLPGYSFAPDSTSELGIFSIGGTLPFDQSVSGQQYYDVDDPTGAEVDNFDGVSFYDVNALGQTNQEILVTDDGGGFHGGCGFRCDRGFGGGHFGGDSSTSPSAGSIFDTTNYGNGFENVYSDVPANGTTPQTITDTFVTPYGDVNIPTTFDAAAALPAAEFSFPTGSTTYADYSFVPDSDYQEDVTSISGQALMNQTVTGQQLYDIEGPNGDSNESFYGVSTHQVDAMGFSNQEILVGDQSVAVARADLAVVGESNAPAPGSFFDTFGGFGFENVYSDIVGTNGANTVTDTLVTPFGDFSIPTTFDATAALNAAEFFFPTS